VNFVTFSLCLKQENLDGLLTVQEKREKIGGYDPAFLKSEISATTSIAPETKATI
jgi:hypothetical protein